MEKMLDKEIKDLLDDVSSLFGVKSDIVKDIWEFTLIALLLRVADNKSIIKRVNIPYIGSIGLKYLGERIGDSDKVEADYEVFVSINDFFKNCLKSIKNNENDEIVEMIQGKIRKLANNF